MRFLPAGTRFPLYLSSLFLWGLSAAPCAAESSARLPSVRADSGAAAADALELPETETRGRAVAVPAGAHRLEGEALRRFATLEEALESLPGFRLRRQGGLGGYSELSFRGARASQVEIYVDGIRLNQDGDGSPDLSKWPLLWFSSLEARSGFDPDGAGPGSLARIDLSTRSEHRAEAQARAGSFSTAEAAVTVQTGAAATEGWRWSVSAEGQSARNDYPFFSDNHTQYYTGDDGVWRMDNNAYWSRGARAGARREAAESRQSFSLLWLDSRKEYPGLFPSTARAYARRTDWLGAWRLEHFGGPLPWEAGVQARRFEDSYRDPGQTLGYLSYEAARASVSGEGDAGVRVPLAPWAGLRADARLRAESSGPVVTPFSEPRSSPEAHRYEAQAGAALEARFAAFSATLEARASRVRFTADGSLDFPDSGTGRLLSADRSPAALRAAAQWNAGAHTVGLLARLEQRAPSSAELLGDNLGIRENLKVRPEETRGLSVSYELGLPSGSVQVTAFRNAYANPIRLKAHGASAFMRYENDADYRALGLETSASARARFAEASASLTGQDVSIREGSYKGNRPAYQSAAEAHLELFLKPTAGTLLGPIADYRSPYYSGDANIPDTRRAAEWEFGAHAGARLGKEDRVRLAVDARNLSDRHYRDFAYSPRSGRSYSLSFSFTL